MMDFIFSTYPDHPWLTEWLVEPRGCASAFREMNAGSFFQTADVVGRIHPNVDAPVWSLQIPIPQNSRITLLFNGFCGYFEHRKQRHGAEVLIPEPGVLWGRFFNIPAPVLLSRDPPVETDGVFWLESDASPALLAVRDQTFCLVTKSHIPADARRVAESFLERDFASALSEELAFRAGALHLFEEMMHHDALTVLSVESMMRALRPAEGSIAGPWSQSPSMDTPHFDTNELYALALAWRHIDIDTAENLIRSALLAQTSSGAIPVYYAPRETYSVLEAPKPLIAKTAEKVWLVRRNAKFLDAVIQPLRRHVQWLLHHFDPKRRGLHCWQSRSELLTPEIYESDLATADLTVLLLTEIEALNRLKQASPSYAEQPSWFEREQDNLRHNLQHQFWNENEGQFCNAIVRGRITRVTGFPAFVPLLWNNLPLRLQSLILDRISESGNLPGGVSLLSWRKSALDDRSFPLLHQLLVLEILKESDPHGTLVNGFVRLIMQGFLEWHTQSVEEYGTLKLDAATAAFIINLQETQHHRIRARGRVASAAVRILRKTRTDWFDIAIILASILAVAGIHIVYDEWRKPPPFVNLEAEMNTAYASKDAQGALRAGRMIIEHYPEQSTMAKLMTGNMLLIQHQYEEAAELLADVRREYPDSPGPMIALGLAYQLQGRFPEAEANYAEFTYLFDDIFPEIVETVQQNRFLMEEGFRSPPKWMEIYRYQLMHEL